MKQAIHLLLCGLLFIPLFSGEEKESLMTYSRKYNEEKYIEIQRYLSPLEELEEDKVISISTSSAEEAERLRWLFCDYFNLMSVNRVFKTTIFDNLIIIGKKKPRSLSAITNIEEGREIGKKLDSLIQELLALPAPRGRIAELALDKSISYTALGIVLGELGRVLGE